MSFILDDNRKVLILRLRGTETPKEKTITETITPFAQESPYLILDLDNKPLTSIGIGTLVTLSKVYLETWGKEKYVRIHLYNLKPQVRDVLELTRVINFFELWDNLDDCYKSLGDEPSP